MGEGVALLIRLLVVVLTVVGPMPFRVRTCAASVPAQTSADAPAPTIPARKTCRCGHNAPEKGEAVAGHEARVHSADCGESHHHHHDCPAATPGPLVRDAGTPPAPDAPTDCRAPHAPLWVESVPLAGTAAVGRIERAHPPKLPLFITLLTLRN